MTFIYSTLLFIIVLKLHNSNFLTFGDFEQCRNSARTEAPGSEHCGLFSASKIHHTKTLSTIKNHA